MHSTVKLRILPSPDGMPLKDFSKHRLSDKYWGIWCHDTNSHSEGSCPICDLRGAMWDQINEQEELLDIAPPRDEKLLEAKKKEIEEMREIAKSLFPRTRYYAAVIVRGQEDQGIQIWDFSQTVYQSIVQDILLNEEYGDITDPHNGTDVIYKRIPHQSLSCTYSVTASRNDSPLLPDATEEEIDQWLEDNTYPDFVEEVMYINSIESIEESLQEVMVEKLGEDAFTEQVSYGAGSTEEEKSLADKDEFTVDDVRDAAKAEDEEDPAAALDQAIGESKFF